MLPPLPFGHAVSKLEGDFDQATELLAQLIPSLKLTPLSKAKHYQSRGAAFEIGHNRLLSSASTPTKTEVEESRDGTSFSRLLEERVCIVMAHATIFSQGWTGYYCRICDEP